MDEHDLIRRTHLVDGMSQRAIAQEPGYARNIVGQVIAHPDPLGSRLSKQRSKPAPDPLKHIIDGWLEQDKLGRPQQRYSWWQRCQSVSLITMTSAGHALKRQEMLAFGGP